MHFTHNMKYLFIAEKPSLMRDVQACYKNHKQEVTERVGEIDFTALSGHVCTNCMPTDYEEWKDKSWKAIVYPMIPDPWQIKPIADRRKQETLAQIKRRAADYDGIIVGTDSDVEGYGIYWLMEQYLGLNEKPALRFIEHSLTDAEILKSLLTMTDYHQNPTHVHFVQSFLIRSRADWLFGMNASRMLTNKRGSLIKAGRVKSPTIKLVYDNSMAIENFANRKYFVLEAAYGYPVAEAGEKAASDEAVGMSEAATIDEGSVFKAVLQNEEGDAQFENPRLFASYALEGIVTAVETKRSASHAPKLFDLAALQAEAGSKYKFKPDQTLELVQRLYEKHKVISYPRTQCRYVSTEKAKEFAAMIENLAVFEDLKLIADGIDPGVFEKILKDKAVVNDAEVAKESHDALLPTLKRPDLSRMSADEQIICRMIYTRLLAQFLPKLSEDKTTIQIRHAEVDEDAAADTGNIVAAGAAVDADAGGIFKATGKIVVEPGWSILYKKSNDHALPKLKKGDRITAGTIQPVQKETSPPKRLTQATLINAMRNIATQIEDKELKKSLADSQGIGTPATRAAIIKDILDSGYIEEKKSGLYITAKGKSYIDAVKDFDIAYPVFAADMDNHIKKVQRGEAEYEQVMTEVLEKLQDMCKKIGQDLEEVEAELAPFEPVQTDIRCIKCGGVMEEQKKHYQCLGCGAKIYKNTSGAIIDLELLRKLESGMQSGYLNFKNRAGKPFRAALKLDEKGEIEMVFFEESVQCPKCRKKAVLNQWGVFCGVKKCGHKLFRSFCGHDFSYPEMKALLDGKAVAASFQSKAGKAFNAKVHLNADGDYTFDFTQEERP